MKEINKDMNVVGYLPLVLSLTSSARPIKTDIL